MDGLTPVFRPFTTQTPELGFGLSRINIGTIWCGTFCINSTVIFVFPSVTICTEFYGAMYKLLPRALHHHVVNSSGVAFRIQVRVVRCNPPNRRYPTFSFRSFSLDAHLTLRWTLFDNFILKVSKVLL